MINIDRHIAVLKRMNWLAIVCMFLLSAIGVMFVYSASRIVDDQPVAQCYRQLMWLAAGSVLFGYIVLTDYRRLSRDAWWLYGITVFLLVLVLIMGKKIGGATRWLYFFGTSVQPSEFAKIASILFLAR